MLDERSKRERREERKTADDQDHANDQADEQRARGREGAERRRHGFLDGKRARDRHGRHDHPEAADQHRARQRQIVEQRVAGEAADGVLDGALGLLADASGFPLAFTVCGAIAFIGIIAVGICIFAAMLQPLGLILALLAAHPDWAQQTAVAVSFDTPNWFAFAGGDIKADLLAQLGFRAPEAITRAGAIAVGISGARLTASWPAPETMVKAGSP